MMEDYTELVKQRIISGDLSKPDDLYPLLVKEIATKKDMIARYLAAKYTGSISVIDVGGASGSMMQHMMVYQKTVVDKRQFDPLPYTSYINEPYESYMTGGYDIAIYSEFLHLFSQDEVISILDNCKAKKIIVIENVPDDFLDLRLRLWSEGGGRCIEPSVITKALGVAPAIINDYYVWEK